MHWEGQKIYTANKGPFAFNVLNHGDFHMRNVMYKTKADGEIEDGIMYDFQISVFASPAIDLTYAMFCFLSQDNRINRRDEFIACYHQQFVETLKLFGYLKAPPSLLDLQIEMLKNGGLQAAFAICIVPMLNLDPSDFTPEDLAAGPEALALKAFSSSSHRSQLMKELPRLVYNGFLN